MLKSDDYGNLSSFSRSREPGIFTKQEALDDLRIKINNRQLVVLRTHAKFSQKWKKNGKIWKKK